jgi:dihydrofolate reductase
MRKLIEYTLVSIDGVHESPQSWGAMSYRDEAYLSDGLGLLLACEAMLMGRRTYEISAEIWPSRSDPWAKRLNAMPKYVFSSRLESAAWSNSTIIRGDAGLEVTKLKQQAGGPLLIWGHGLLTATLFEQQLVDLLDLSIHPVIVGRGGQFFREALGAKLKLIASKSFSKIVKLTYEPQYVAEGALAT